MGGVHTVGLGKCIVFHDYHCSIIHILMFILSKTNDSVEHDGSCW